MEKLSLSRIQKIQEELKKANRLLDEYFRKEALKNREEKLKKFSNAEKRAYWAGKLDERNEVCATRFLKFRKGFRKNSGFCQDFRKMIC